MHLKVSRVLVGKTIKRILGYLIFLAPAALAIPAGAAVITWSVADDTVGTCNGTASTCLLTDTANGLTTIKLRAYSNGVWQGSNAPGPVGGSWIAAPNELLLDGSTVLGYGVANTIQQSATEEQNEPQTATDNREVLDIMVIQLPTLPPGKAWDPAAFGLGYARTINGDGTAGSGTTAGLSMFIGTLANDYDFAANQVCFDTAGGTCSGSQKGLIAQLGFQDITAAIQGGGAAVLENQSTTITTNASGNYLVITGRLGEGDDAFNITSISASDVDVSIPDPLPDPLPPPGGVVNATWSALNDTVGTCNGTTSTCLLTDTADGLTTVKFRAYSNGVWQGSNAPGPVGGSWIAANTELFYDGSTVLGYGVANTIQQSASEELNVPQHATDNREVLDIMVIELLTLPPGPVFDPMSFVLGYARTINADGTSGTGTTAGLSMFIGTLSENYDFAANNVCFDTAGGTCSGSQKGLIADLGFQDITAAIQGGGAAVPENQSRTITTNAFGNYIIVTGRLGEGDDAFNITSISSGTPSTPAPDADGDGIPDVNDRCPFDASNQCGTGQAPEPATLALLALALAGLGFSRRRSRNS